jgi:hypothetical protein
MRSASVASASASHVRSFAILFLLILLCYKTLCVGHAVTQLVQALRYKPEGRRLDSRLCH